MVRIVKYTASEGLINPGQPNTAINPVENPGVKDIANIGAAISDIGSYFTQKQQKKEDFKAEDGYRKLQMTLGEQLKTGAEEMADDGDGFHQRFTEQVYAPARNQFLAGLPDRLKQKYSVILGDDGSDTQSWSIKAAEAQHAKSNEWYKNQLAISQSDLQTAINRDPDGYDTILKQGLDQIEAADLPASQKEQQRQQWTKLAQLAHLDRMLESNPEAILKDLGADPRNLTPTTQYNLLRKALITKESGGKDDVISPKGAIGRMQVMPATAKDISKWMGDGLIDKDMSDARITEIMSNPVINERYGDFYLKRQIKDFSAKGGIEAALVAYNAGPKVAKEWIDSGFDNSKLPSETRNYVRTIMRNLPSLAGQDRFGGGSTAPKGDPASVKIEFNRNGQAPIEGQTESALNQDLTGRVKSAFAGLGINRVKATSGFRSEADNKRVGGADKSQHLHGNALDIDVSGYSIQERVNIIKALSAAGVTGLGIGSNIIHADVGGRRAWGYASSSGGGAVPKWAEAAIAEHLENRATAPSRTNMGGRYAGLPYDIRGKYINAADNALTRQQTEANKATALQRVELQTSMRNELASLQTSGQSTGLVDDTSVSTVLGEDDYYKWVNDKQQATRIYAARDGISQMSVQEMDDRLKEYAPDDGSPDYAQDLKVQAAVQKEIDRVTKMRAADPANAAMLYPEVKKQFDAIDPENPAPTAVQEYVRLNLEKQKEFGIKPGSEEPVPRAWAVQIGQRLGKIPELQGKNKNDVNASIIVLYDSLKKTFGDYTDEVIISALKEYKGVGPNTAALVGGYMQAIQSGGDPLARVRAQQDRALDQDQVEGATQGGFWDSMSEFFTGKKIEGLRPFNPGERRDNGDGTYSTEITTTWQLPDGKWANVPSLWKDANGKNVQFDPNDEDGILGALNNYERQRGTRFKRFNTEEEAVAAAKAKSSAGGVDAPELNSEQLMRARTAIENLGEDMTPEQEESLVRRFGKNVVDGAKASINGATNK